MLLGLRKRDNPPTCLSQKMRQTGGVSWPFNNVCVFRQKGKKQSPKLLIFCRYCSVHFCSYFSNWRGLSSDASIDRLKVQKEIFLWLCLRPWALWTYPSAGNSKDMEAVIQGTGMFRVGVLQAAFITEKTLVQILLMTDQKSQRNVNPLGASEASSCLN